MAKVTRDGTVTIELTSEELRVLMKAAHKSYDNDLLSLADEETYRNVWDALDPTCSLINS